jgi:hypothetical protein
MQHPWQNDYFRAPLVIIEPRKSDAFASCVSPWGRISIGNQKD